ncbi:MAG: sugar transferase [Patescibacteria group bacterium]
MGISRHSKIITLVLGDFLFFYLSLYITLFLRYQKIVTAESWNEHKTPFLFIYALWIFIFYINNVYDIKNFVSYKNILEGVLKTMGIAGAIAIFIFYLVPGISIAPKTNLFLNIIIASLFLILWRRLFWNLTKKISKTRVLFLEGSQETINLVDRLKRNPQLGYEPVVMSDPTKNDFMELLQEKNTQLVVASKATMKNQDIAKKFYKAIPLGVTFIDFSDFYESLVEKIPISTISEEWFLENLKEINKKNFEKLKRVSDILGAIVLFVPLLILTPFVSILIKTGSRGPVFYKQKRVGKNESFIEIIKFRSMIQDAEKNGATWAKKEDPRITKIGKFLRKTRLDELPQIWNVLKGDLSFVGPRPERPEFIKELKKTIPYYSIRHLVKPGLSGWAQIKYPYGASVHDAKEKLQYDLYYIKNRSLILDLAVSAKTIATILKSQGQ